MILHKQKEPWTSIGAGVHLDQPGAILELGFPDRFRKGHFWCFGTTRVGKTRVMEHIIEQDIKKGYSVVAIDPKGDIDLFSKITELAIDTGRQHDLMLITPIFPEYSAILDPLSSYQWQKAADLPSAGTETLSAGWQRTKSQARSLFKPYQTTIAVSPEKSRPYRPVARFIREISINCQAAEATMGCSGSVVHAPKPLNKLSGKSATNKAR